jgi:hypothetical protein
MDIKAGQPYPAGALSNFIARPFVFRGVLCNSMEGLLQGLKYKNPDMQKHICTLVGRKAKMTGRHKNWYESQTLWWQGAPIKRGSEEYQELLDEAFVCLFTQNKKAEAALMATGNAKLTHSIGNKDPRRTVLTEREFCSRLMDIRATIKLNNVTE